MPSHWFLYTDGQTELLAGMGETTDKLLQAVFCMRSQGCVVREQHLADDFCFRTQSGNVEERGTQRRRRKICVPQWKFIWLASY